MNTLVDLVSLAVSVEELPDGTLLYKDGDGNNLEAPAASVVQDFRNQKQAEYAASQYQRDRKYPTLTEQAYMQYWDALNGTTTWQDAITAVKAEFPKTTGV